ncbi:MAG: ABC transporter permease subunit [Rhizobiales bacterium]|nr:ABC transporter permease subunit [Hyphomicrobiales bacterium]
MSHPSGLRVAARLEVQESLRARWFFLYAAVFFGLMLLLAFTGISESRVLGFTGLSRLLVTYIQITMAVLPLFILVTTARSLVGDREVGNLEYMLAFPMRLGHWYWGKFLGRLILIVVPVLAALAFAVVYGELRGHDVPWMQVSLYAGLVCALAACFLGLGFFLSSLARSTEVSLGSSLVIWLLLVALLDLLLLSILIRSQFDPAFIVGIALANPLQTFRTASMILFDPQLILLGPASYIILDRFGVPGYVVWALVYPSVLGVVAAAAGFWRFRSTDLV